MGEGRPIRITHILPGLKTGGAEKLLLGLLKSTDYAEFAPKVVSMTDGGDIADEIRALGIEVSSLRMQPGVPDPLAAVRLRKYLRAEPPDVIQGWLYQGNLLATVASYSLGGVP